MWLSGARQHGKHLAPPRWRQEGLPRYAAHQVLSLVAVLAVSSLLLLAVGPRTGLYRTVTMLSASMRPTYPPGAVLLDVPESMGQLRVGQVVTYRIPVDDQRVVSHRVVSFHRSGSGVDVQTKGDANNAPDPWVAHMVGSQVWTVRGVAPYAGLPILWLRDPRLRAWLLYVVPGVMLLWVLVGIWRPRGTR